MEHLIHAVSFIDSKSGYLSVKNPDGSIVQSNLKWDEKAKKLIMKKEATKPVCGKCGGNIENHLDYIHCTDCELWYEPQDD